MGEERKVGENFDEKTAADIFDKLKNVEGKKDDSKFKKISDMMNEAKYLEEKGQLEGAADLYKQIIFTLPDSKKAYEALIGIYQSQGNVDSEKDILMKAISNCKDNNEFKKRLDEIKS